MVLRSAFLAFAVSVVLCAQEPAPAARTESANPDEFVVAMGTRVPLSMINSVSTKTAVSGERVYLETVFPILVNGHVVIPPGSYVAGTITEVKRPGRVKGRGELYVRFDSLTLPNGVTRDFRARMGSLRRKLWINPKARSKARATKRATSRRWEKARASEQPWAAWRALPPDTRGWARAWAPRPE